MVRQLPVELIEHLVERGTSGCYEELDALCVRFPRG
jgi:hypothetical protein